MKHKRLVFLIPVLIAVLLFGCAEEQVIKGSYHEAFIEMDEQKEEIGNVIPDWVVETVNSEPLYVITENLKDFDDYAVSEFPDICDAYWTQEQSDAAYLGQGIRNFQLDDKQLDIVSVDYPVILNGHVVSILTVYRIEGSDELHWQLGPNIANEWNSFIGKTDEASPILFGFNNNNGIVLQGGSYYVLAEDYVERKPVDTSTIPVINKADYSVVNVLEPLCTERTADVSEWVILPAGD